MNKLVLTFKHTKHNAVKEASKS